MLLDILEGLQTQGDPFFDMVKYTVNCANLFFRTLRKSGVFISGHARTTALRAGLDMNDTSLHGGTTFELANI